MFIKLKQVAAAVLAIGISGSALALPAASTAFTAGAINNLSDDFGEFVLNSDGSLKLGGVLAVGDILFSSLGITSYAPSGTVYTTVNQLTVLTAIQITSISAPVADAFCGATFISTAGDCAGFSFSAPTIGLSAVLAALGPAYNSFTNTAALALTGNSVAVFLENPTHVYTTADLTTGAVGDLRLVVDLDAGLGDAWTAVGPTDLADFINNDVGEGIGSFSLDLTITGQAFAGWDVGPQFTGRGNLSRAESTAQTPVGGDASFFFEANRVPEPASVALVGLALLGLGLTRRSKS